MIGWNKGISRKNEENSQLRNDVSDLESRIDEFQTNWASQEAELGMFEISFRPQSSRRPSRRKNPLFRIHSSNKMQWKPPHSEFHFSKTEKSNRRLGENESQRSLYD